MNDSGDAESDESDDAIRSEGDAIDTDALLDVATRAVRTGGDYLVGEFRTGPVAGEYGTDDVKAIADREAERRVVDVIRGSFPDHAIHGEESGRSGDGRYEWVVDPLDGTNNFASGIPLFATAVAVLRDGEPIVSAIYEPLPDTLYRAVAGEGATANGEPLVVGRGGAVSGEREGSDRADGLAADTDDANRPFSHATISFVVGLPAVRDPDLREAADEILDALEFRCKRVVRTWAPCVDWGLVAAGSLDGIVCFHPDVYEQHAGSLLAAEAGVVSVERDEIYVGGGDEETTDTLWAIVEAAIGDD